MAKFKSVLQGVCRFNLFPYRSKYLIKRKINNRYSPPIHRNEYFCIELQLWKQKWLEKIVNRRSNKVLETTFKLTYPELFPKTYIFVIITESRSLRVSTFKG